MQRGVLLVGLMLVLPGSAGAMQANSGRAGYLDLAKEAYQHGLSSCPADVETWRKSYQPSAIWGYTPPDGPVWFARLAASLYEATGEEPYAREAAKWLAGHHEFKTLYPESLRTQRPEYARGLPTLTDFFQLPYYGRAYQCIKDSPTVTDVQRHAIETSIAESANFVFNHPEWGPMNRAMLRAEGLLIAAQILPSHEDATKWKRMATILAQDSWGQWEEEDAQIYHAVWIASLIRYAEAAGAPSLYEQPTFRYYFDYFTHLLSPVGMIPDFGDARWNENWAEYVACLECAAAKYHRGDHKWAAGRIRDAMLAQHDRPLPVRVGLQLIDAYRWADDTIAPIAPVAGSEEVLEDLVGKKIVFRDGWDDKATYMLLNYRDEGPFARTPRNFLRHSIPVEEEKAHHGHADENSICLLTSGGSVLLHDAGYRDALPSGAYGAFRADYFHNRLVGRQLKRDRTQPLFEFLRHSGAYRPVTTEKVDFARSEEVDVSRTRMTDRRTGYQADRVVAYLKPDDVFVVVDIIKILEPDVYTFATLWHAQSTLDSGPRHFVTATEKIDDYRLATDRALLIAFPQTGTRQTGTFPIRRYDQDEAAIYQTLSSHYHAGHIETFVTVLVPHDRGQPVGPMLEGIKLLDVDNPRHGVCVELKLGPDKRYVCVKTDLDREILTANVRPRYTFESGKVNYGPFETDASFLYVRTSGASLNYWATHLVRINYNGETIFTAEPTTFSLQPDGQGIEVGASKWRMWQGQWPLPAQKTERALDTDRSAAPSS